MLIDGEKIIVIDDDPTGSQTVHSCPVLLRWDPETLAEGLAQESLLCFILSNTRGMPPPQAAHVTREIALNLHQVLSENANFSKAHTIVVSRSDSTLRGHYPLEIDVLNEVLGPFDAHFLVPAFFEGGRITRGDTHYVQQDGPDIPVHLTEFAKDSVFGYQHSYLPKYVEEKTAGKIRSNAVLCLSLEELRAGCLPKLMNLQQNQCVVVNAEKSADLAAFAKDVHLAVAAGKHFLFRSAASLLSALAALPAQPIPPIEMGRLVRGDKPGAILVGSHVRKTTQQLKRLLDEPGLEGIEINVDTCVGPASFRQLSQIREQITCIHERGNDVVLYTSRHERQFSSQESRLDFGARVSAFLMDIVRVLPRDLGFLISKGGITSNDVLSDGLALRKAEVIGQILSGCSVLQCPEDHPRFPGLPVVIFPGNVGDDDGLVLVRGRIRR